MKKRLIAILLASVTCITALAGCGSKTAQAGENNSATVMTVDGENIPASELAAYICYNLYYYKNYYGMEADAFADETMFNSIKESCANQVLTLRGIQAMAKDLGVSLTKDQLKELEETKKTNMGYLNAETTPFKRWVAYTVKGKEDPWETYLHSMGYTDELFESDSKTMKLEEALVDYYYDQGDITKTYNDTYYHAKSILISDSDEDGKLLTGDAKKEAKAKAKEILKKINDGEDFDELWSENNADTAQSEDGYYFTANTMVPEYEEAVQKLEVGETTNKLVYYKGYGWFIIQRLELDEDALTDSSKCMQSSENNETTIKSEIGDAMVNEKVQEYIDKLEVEYTDEYDKITVYNVNTYLGFVSEPLASEGSGSAGSADSAEVIEEVGSETAGSAN